MGGNKFSFQIKQSMIKRTVGIRSGMGYFYPIILLCLFTVITACEDNRLIDIAEDKVYFLHAGLHEHEVINHDDASCEVVLVKSGIGQQTGAVRLLVDEGVLQNFNSENSTEYLPLPSEMYTIAISDLDIGKEDYRSRFRIDMNAPAIRELQQETDQTYVIPLQAQVVNGNITESEPGQLESLLIPRIIEPYLALADTGLVSGNTVLNFDSPDEVDLFSVVEVNFPNDKNIEFGVEIDPVLVQEYNDRNGTSYEILNPESYEIVENSLTLNNFENEHPFGITLYKSGFVDDNEQYKFGDYLIPIRLVSKGDVAINPDWQTQLLQVSFQPNRLDRSNWEITEWNSCICEEPQYDGLERVPENLLDGDPETFWGSKWDEPRPFPYHFVFDMKSNHKVFLLDLIKPWSTSWRGNLKSGYFEISEDGDNWTRLGDWEMEENAIRQHTYQVNPQSGRYIKLVIEEAFTYFDPETGVEGGANVDLAEFVVWGE